MRRVRENARDISGIILLDKAKGESSNRSLQRVKRILMRGRRDTQAAFDPLATGVLLYVSAKQRKFLSFYLRLTNGIWSK